MRIAIIGSGVSGLVAAHLLHERHEVTVFEARDRIGGHVHTVDVEDRAGRPHSVDLGFIVYNETNYPLFSRLLEHLNVPTQPSDMSFGVRSDSTGVEYSSATVSSMLAKPINALRPSFYSMVRDILRFNREAAPAIRNGAAELTLGEYLESSDFSDALRELYLQPMGSALWSVPQGQVMKMPARFFVDFFDNHGMLSVNDQPDWRVVTGGSTRYVEALTAGFRGKIRTGASVGRVTRMHAHVSVDGEFFDQVIFACHSDQALEMLTDANRAEREILGALPYQANDVVLHTDTSVLPRSRRAWASWNYRTTPDAGEPATVTYNMNRLQTLESPDTFCVSLNATETLNPDLVLHRTTFSHPVYTLEGVKAQRRRAEICGVSRTHFCGAYWGFGFHEDGVRSAVDVATRLGATPW